MLTTALINDVASRAPLPVDEAYSGSRLERVELADGRRLVLKYLPPEGDWLTRACDGLGRTRDLWERGLLDALDAVVEHGVVGHETSDGADVLVMRDLSETLWPARVPLGPARIRMALGGLARIHDLGERLLAQRPHLGDGLCTVGARYGMFSPQFHASDDGPHQLSLREDLLAGWQSLEAHVDADVYRAVRAVHADPEGFGRTIQARCSRPTVLHGDTKPENLGVEADGRLTAIDWGEMTGIGPREVDVAWLALMSTKRRLAAAPSDVIDWYEDLAAVSLDPVLLDLVSIGSLAQMGFQLALVSELSRKPETRERADACLSWWNERVRVSLERGHTP